MTATAASAETARRYCAFISYSHRDDTVARWLHTSLETYRMPKGLVGRVGEYGPVQRALGRVFRDEEELAGAAELGPRLEQALKDSAALVVICSPAAARSEWVDREIKAFKAMNPDRPVLAVIAKGVPGSEHEECFPEGLRHHVDADGKLLLDAEAEPLAPDLQKLDRDAVKLKLIAGLAGVAYGELARRDLRRARKRMAAFSAAAFAVIVALSVLSGLAVTYARLAVQQRKIAEHNAEEAENRAWLAQIAAQEVRRQADQIQAHAKAVDCAPAKAPAKVTS